MRKKDNFKNYITRILEIIFEKNKFNKNIKNFKDTIKLLLQKNYNKKYKIE